MNILIAPDSYKGSLSATEAAAAMARGFKRGCPDAQITQCPLADGGEGTLDVLLVSGYATRQTRSVIDAYGREHQAAWGWDEQNATAFIELAQASGLCADMASKPGAVERASTFGVVQLIREALDKQVQHIVLTLGGSATNDAGAGMLTALGAQLLDAEGHCLPLGAAALERVQRVALDALDPRLASVSFTAAVDVSNPLLGQNGATAIFGPQKGVAAGSVTRLDRALANFARCLCLALDKPLVDFPGAGAAGGMGFAAQVALGAELTPGIELVMRHCQFDCLLKKCDWVVTGEGRLDGQSLAGKTPIGVSKAAAVQGVPVVVLAGSLGDGWQNAYQAGVTAAFSLVDGPVLLVDAIAHTNKLIEDRCEALARLMTVNQINNLPKEVFSHANS